MLVGGAILPHPPIILPAVAGRRGSEVDPTIDAVGRACGFVAGLRPERLVIASPHEGHGFEVPLAFLREALGRLPPVRRVLTSDDPYAVYLERGEQLRVEEGSRPPRTAVIASGDCSHRLRADGPYGFHPNGPKLDEAILAGVRTGDPEALLGIDPEVLAEGAECGLRSFVYVLSALAPARAEVLSYQDVYGVGYLVATLSTE